MIPDALITDSFLNDLGKIPTQKKNWRDRLIAYSSSTLNKGKRNYSATKRKLSAIVFFINYSGIIY